MDAPAGLERLDEFRWLIPRTGAMRVPGIVFADRGLLEHIVGDRTLDQVRNAATMPGILEASIAMPDAHWGYGLPVGGVVAFDPDEGVVSPGAVGYDIGCGVRLMRTRLTRAELEPKVEALADALYHEVPCGVGSTGTVRLPPGELNQVLRQGARWAVGKGMGHAGRPRPLRGGRHPGRRGPGGGERGRPGPGPRPARHAGLGQPLP
jgi:Uncharacterized conserved protein